MAFHGLIWSKGARRFAACLHARRMDGEHEALQLLLLLPLLLVCLEKVKDVCWGEVGKRGRATLLELPARITVLLSHSPDPF